MLRCILCGKTVPMFKGAFKGRESTKDPCQCDFRPKVDSGYQKVSDEQGQLRGRLKILDETYKELNDFLNASVVYK